MPNATSRKERLNFRLDPKIKDLIERAACVKGQSITEFAISSLAEDARAVLRDHETTVLSDRDRDRFLAMLEEPPEPNEALKKAAKIYRQQRA